MRIKRFIVKIVCFAGIISCIFIPKIQAQNNATAKELMRKYESASGPREKVNSLFRLIDYCYAFNNEARADSLRDLQLMIAEESGQEDLKIRTLFPIYYSNCFNSNSSRQRFNKELGFAGQALEFAKSLEKKEYEALAYAHLATVYRVSGQLEQASKNADIAYSTAISSGNDSAKVITGLETGNVFMEKKDLLMAFRKYSNAYEIANNLRNNDLLSKVYFQFSMLYFKLKSNEQAKGYVLKSIAINSGSGNRESLIRDYILIGKIVDFIPAKTYLNRAVQLADSINNPVLKLMSNQMLFNLSMIADPEQTFGFLKAHPDVEEAFYGLGNHHHDWIIGEIFLYSGNYDSAYIYFKKAEPAYNSNSEFPGRINFLGELAACCKYLKLYDEAKKNYLTILNLANSTLKIRDKSSSLYALQQLYAATGDYTQAYQYLQSFNLLQDSINQLNREKDMVLLEIENENKHIQKENELAAIALQRRYDAQYMLITITVATAFILLVFLGLFTVSKTTVKVLGFFSFIFLFELITLLLDNRIHHLTHGEPGKVWLIKICIISLMLPFHHWVEHRIIQYLISRKMITVGRFFNFKKLAQWFSKKKAPDAVTSEAGVPVEKNETAD